MPDILFCKYTCGSGILNAINTSICKHSGLSECEREHLKLSERFCFHKEYKAIIQLDFRGKQANRNIYLTSSHN